MQHYFKILFCVVFLFSSIFLKGQCLNLNAQLKNIDTKLPVMGASFWFSDGVQRRFLGKTINDTIDLHLPCNAQKLFVNANGYREYSISLNNSTNSNNDLHWIFPVLLVPEGQQISDRPYSQREQKYFELKNEGKNGSPFAIRSFTVIDAIKQIVIPASICIVSTKSGIKDCFEVKGKLSKEIKFTENDIIALEVKATGYQNFNGNLIVEKLDNKRGIYEIKLNKEQTVLSLIVNNSPKSIICELITGSESVLMSKSDNNRFSASITPDKPYKIRIKSSEKGFIFEEAIVPKVGINTKYISIKTFEEPLKNIEIIQPNNSAVSESIPFSLKDKYILLFDQSQYILKPEAKKILDELSPYLLQKNESKIQIEGYSDNIGSIKLNNSLSELRAMIIKNYLSMKGLQDSRFVLIGLGGKFANPNDTEENRAMNRRVEITIKE